MRVLWLLALVLAGCANRHASVTVGVDETRIEFAEQAGPSLSKQVRRPSTAIVWSAQPGGLPAELPIAEARLVNGRVPERGADGSVIVGFTEVDGKVMQEVRRAITGSVRIEEDCIRVELLERGVRLPQSGRYPLRGTP